MSSQASLPSPPRASCVHLLAREVGIAGNAHVPWWPALPRAAAACSGACITCSSQSGVCCCTAAVQDATYRRAGGEAAPGKASGTWEHVLRVLQRLVRPPGWAQAPKRAAAAAPPEERRAQELFQPERHPRPRSPPRFPCPVQLLQHRQSTGTAQALGGQRTHAGCLGTRW